MDVPGAAGTGDGAINDRGQVAGTYGDSGDIVGFYTDDNGRAHAFLLSYRRFVTAPGAADTVAEGINNRGEIAGFYFEARL